jgi:MFS transporter, PPP family, 3-phenylpropionic acid transporter
VQRSPSSAAIRLGAFYAVVYGLVGIRLPHFPGWLEDRGLTPAEIGTLLGLGPLMTLALSAVVGQAAERMRDERPMMVVLALASAALYVGFPLVDGFFGYFLLSFGVSAMMVPMPALADAMAIRASRRGELDYGRTRLFGSLGFVVTSVGLGFVLAGAPSSATIWALVLSSLLIALGAALLPLAPGGRSVGGLEGATTFALLARPRFRRFLLCAGFLQLAHGVIYGVGSLHFRRLGCSDETIGLLWSLGVVVEIAFFATTRRFVKRASAGGLLSLGAVGAIVRWLLLSTATSLPLLYAAQALHCLSFAAAHLGSMVFIERSVPEASAATGLHSSLSLGLALAVGMPLAGQLYESFGGGAFLAAVVASAVGLVLALSLREGEATDDVSVTGFRRGVDAP